MVKVAFHLGLGDAIVSASIIQQIADGLFDVVEVPCWEHNFESVVSIFRPLKNARPFVVENDHDFKTYDFILGQYLDNNQRPNEDFIQWFYRQAKMREYPFPFEEAAQLVKQEPLVDVFVHDDKERGFIIPVDGYRPEKHGSILKHVDQIKNAKEIHCIDSSFIHLVERLPTKGKLFYHKYARPHSPKFQFKKDWTILSSPESL